jgi:molecular chaperone GrpE
MTGSSSRRTPGGPGRPSGWEGWGGPGRGPSAERPPESGSQSASGGESAQESPCGVPSDAQRPTGEAAGSFAGNAPGAGFDHSPDEETFQAEGEPDPLTEVSLERDEFRDALIRLQADFENYKKRILKQQTDHLERAAESLVEKLLPVLDAADLALAHGGGDDVKQIATALVTTLEREGLERIVPGGGPFDPTLHEAVAHEPSDDAQQEVVEVMRAGYRWKGRVLRPAMVKVRG